MNEITRQNLQLPNTMEELHDFVLFSREKLISVKAEIRAIDKLGLAEEVRNQKREEARLLSEAIIDAETRIGELLSEIPKASAGRPPEEEIMFSAEHNFSKPKNEVLKDIGYSQSRAQRYENLAKNKDIIEQVKQAARENDDFPTRAEILNLSKARARQEAIMETEQMTGLEAALKYNEICYNVSKEVKKFINIVRRMEINDEKLQMCSRYMDKHDADVYLPVISEGIGKLVALQNYLKGLKK